MSKVAIIVVAMAMAVSLPASADSTRTDTKLYTQLAGDDQMIDCDAADPDLGGIGGVCFDLWGDELNIQQLTIRDQTGLPVGAFYSMRDTSEGANLAVGQFCGSASDLAIPEYTTWIGIWIDGPLFGPEDCLLSDTSPGIGIRGYVDITFTVGDPA